ncbi:hypothetical protein ABC733_28680 [Mangrovibacter sp. SLW1]
MSHVYLFLKKNNISLAFLSILFFALAFASTILRFSDDDSYVYNNALFKINHSFGYLAPDELTHPYDNKIYQMEYGPTGLGILGHREKESIIKEKLIIIEEQISSTKPIYAIDTVGMCVGFKNIHRELYLKINGLFDSYNECTKN